MRKKKLKFVNNPAAKFALVQQIHPEAEVQASGFDRKDNIVCAKISKFTDYEAFSRWLREQFDKTVSLVEWRAFDVTHVMVARDEIRFQ